MQKFANKVCTKQWREPYNSLRTSLKLPLLKERRAVLKLSVLYKYLNGLAVMPPNTFAPLTHSGRNLHSSNNFYLHQPFAHSNSYLYSWGLCKTWTLDWTGLWTGLTKQLYAYTKATTACPQLYLKLLPCCWALEASSSRFLRGQRSHAYLISFNKGGSDWLLVHSLK